MSYFFLKIIHKIFGNLDFYLYIYYVIKIENMILKKEQTKGIEIDLTGPQGNAFFLLGTASKLGRQLGLDSDEIEIILRNMRSGDYENLIETFDKNFGSFVTLYR